MWKFLNRFLLFVIVSFILINSAAFFALNSPIIQNAILSYVNTNYLGPQKLRLNVNSFNLNPFTGALNLNEIDVTETSVSKDPFHFKLSQISVVFNLTSSYVTRKPVIKKILLRGSEIHLAHGPDGRILWPDFLKASSESKGTKAPLDIPDLLKTYTSFLPTETAILNVRFTIGQEQESRYQNVNLSYFELSKVKAFLSKPTLKFKILINNTLLRLPIFKSDLYVQNVKAEGDVTQDGKFDLSALSMDSNVLTLKSKASGKLESQLKKSKYQAEISNLEIMGEPFFRLIDLKSSGILAGKGRLSSDKDFFDIPKFTGKLNWKNLTLQGFDIYSGTADVSLKEKKIFYKDAKIISKNKGIVSASGEYDLFGNFAFNNKVTIENFSFAELLAGLRASGSPVDFLISAQNISVTGNIKSKNPKNLFDLSAVGEGVINRFLVSTFDQKGRNPLPQLHFNLNLNANAQKISIDKTVAALQGKGSSGKVAVQKGEIDLAPKKGVGVFVGLTGKDIDLSLAQYFLKTPASGKADLDGEVRVTPGVSGVFFKARSTAQDGQLFGVHFKQLSGQWGIDPDAAWVSKTEIQLGENDLTEKSAGIHIENLRVKFKNLDSDVNASAQGNVSGLVSALSFWVPKEFLSTSGDIKSFQVRLKGPLLSPERWDFNADIKATDLNVLDGQIGKSDVLLNCLQGVCSRSHLIFTQIFENHDTIKKKKNQQNGGFFIAELENFSFLYSGFKLRASRIPISMFQPLIGDTRVHGLLSGEARMIGKWTDRDAWVDLGLRQTQLASFDVGDVKFTARPKSNMLQINMMAFQDQVSIDYDLSQSSQESSTLALHFRDFDPTLFLESHVRARNNLFSQFTGDFAFRGPSLLVGQKDKSKSFLKSWTGFGAFKKGTLQAGSLLFQMDQMDEIILSKGIFSMKGFRLSGELGTVKASGQYDFLENAMDMMLGLDLDLAHLHEGFSAFDPSQGSVSGMVYAKGTLARPRLSGGIEINSKTLQIKRIPPALTDVKGRIVFSESKANIENLTANKGNGSLNLDGWVDFSQMMKGESSDPSIYVNSVMRNANFHLQMPVIQTVDLDLNSDIILSGTKRPYRIAGQMNLNRLHVFRELTCGQLSSEFLSQPKGYQNLAEVPFADLDVDIRAARSIDIQTKCVAGKFSTNPILTVVGDTSQPLLNGGIMADSNVRLFVLKSRFNVKKADIQFVDLQKYDPNVDIQMEARYSPSYTLYWNIYGRLSEARLDLSVDPPTLPNGDRILQADLISAISTGQMPLESSSGNLLAASTGAASFLGIGNVFETTLNDTVTKVTGGLIDSVSVVPTTQSGQLSWRATARKSLSSRFDLGISYESGSVSTTQSSYANYMFNDTVSAIGSYNYTSYFQQQSTQEFFSGLRFYFGTQ